MPARDFQIEELFVSTTDKRGVIQLGNDIFVRVSAYERAELVGAPHSIVRHPDMPKAVFKLFWQLLKADKFVVAYVKNRAKTDDHYWVMATAFPTRDGYFSIRMKPTTPYFEATAKLYQETKTIEDREGVDAAGKFLMGGLKSLGFETYESFMLKILDEELKARERQMKRAAPKVVQGNLVHTLFSELWLGMKAVGEGVAEAHRSVQSLKDFQAKLADCSANVSSACEQLQSLGVNMSIASHKLGKEGGTLAVVAHNFQQASPQILRAYQTFSRDALALMEHTSALVTDVLCSRLLVEMLQFYCEEILNRPKKTSQDVVELKMIFEHANRLFNESLDRRRALGRTLRSFKNACLQLKNLVLRLELIRTGGMVESSRSSHTQDIFAPFLSSMEKNLTTVSLPINGLGEFLDAFIPEFDAASLQLIKTEFAFAEASNILKTAEDALENLHPARPRSREVA